MDGYSPNCYMPAEPRKWTATRSWRAICNAPRRHSHTPTPRTSNDNNTRQTTMAPLPQYGSIATTSPEEDADASLELLPHGHSVAESYNNNGGDGASGTANGGEKSKVAVWTRRHYISYSVAACLCLFLAHYWHDRSVVYDDSSNSKGRGDVTDPTTTTSSSGRVPITKPLSTLDPASDLGFRVVEREGLASPSLAWGDKMNNKSDGEGLFTPLPTNEWYLVRCVVMCCLVFERIVSLLVASF